MSSLVATSVYHVTAESNFYFVSKKSTSPSLLPVLHNFPSHRVLMEGGAGGRAREVLTEGKGEVGGVTEPEPTNEEDGLKNRAV